MKSCEKCGSIITVFGENVGKCESCGALYSLKNGEYDAPDMESLYKEAIYDMGLDTEEYLAYAIEIFEKVGDYKDAKVRIEKCKEKIKEKEKVKAAHEHMIYKYTNYAKWIGIIALIVFVIVFSVYNHKKKIYNQACELYNQYSYEEALIKFEKLGDFKDSENKVIEINRLIEERNTAYERGFSFYYAEQYENAVTEFSKCLTYKDSKTYYEDSCAKLLALAEEAERVEDYEHALRYLAVIPENCSVYNDALVMLTKVRSEYEAKKTAENYALAEGYYQQNQFDIAQTIFIELGNYERSAEYLDAIGEYYYDLASAAYAERNYNECARALEYIDSVEEWKRYREADDLRASARTEYIELLQFEGKQISRADGYSAMVSYVDSMNNGLLSADDIASIKEYCKIITIDLSDLTPFASEGGGLYSSEHDEDSLGTVHEKIYWSVSDQSSSFYLNGEYCVLTAVISVSPKTANLSGTRVKTGSVYIYGDDILLYSEPQLTKNTMPHEIEIDVTGVTVLRIEMIGEDWSTLGDFIVYMCDPKLST